MISEMGKGRISGDCGGEGRDPYLHEIRISTLLTVVSKAPLMGTCISASV